MAVSHPLSGENFFAVLIPSSNTDVSIPTSTYVCMSFLWGEFYISVRIDPGFAFCGNCLQNTEDIISMVVRKVSQGKFI